MTKISAVRLEDNKTLEILKGLPEHMLQGKRLVELLSQKPHSPTGHVAQHCAIGNLSDVARNVNPYLFKHGLMIGCEKPLQPIINKFSEQSNQFLWSLYGLPVAANDAIYSQEGEG